MLGRGVCDCCCVDMGWMGMVEGDELECDCWTGLEWVFLSGSIWIGLQ